MRIPTSLLLLALGPLLLLGQKRDDILSIQRDVAQLQDQVRQLQAAQDQKMSALESLVRQAVEQSSGVSTASAALQRSLTDRLNEQQAKVEAPIAVLGTKVDQSSDELRAVRENLAELARRMATLDNKLADISSAVRTLNTSTAPPPAANAAPPASPAPAGVTAESLWQKAVRDYTAAKDKQALAEFADFLKYFPDHANAAEGQYYMGLIYDHGEQYDDSAQVFQAVVERYPDSPKAADAMYMKGVEYQKGGSDKEAIAAYRAFIKQYPKHANVPKAQARIRALTAAPAVKATKKRKQ
jgi:TolA-binding protein